MQTVELQQGTPEWHAFRAAHYTASDAPAMLGTSPYKTRNALLREKKLGITPELDAATQARMARGHEYEALARSIAEVEMGEELYPVVGVCAAHPKLAASFDGITMDGCVVWEHKTLNNTIRAAAANGEIPEHHRAQLEQQLLVAEADKAIFCASNGADERVSIAYTSDPAMRKRIIDGWAQFDADLQKFEVQAEAAQAAVGRTPENLPALRIEVTGQVTASNLADFKAHALAVFAGINRNLVTDQDFADAEQTVKWCGNVEERLQAAKQHALSQTASIDELFRAIDDISAEARRARLELDKLVKARKEAIRAEIVAAGQKSLQEHVAALNARIGRPLMPAVHADFAAAIKGKRTIDSLRGAVDDTLAQAKIDANAIADRITINLRALDEHKEHAGLFPDVGPLVLKQPDDLAAVIAQRIAEHEAREQARRQAEEEAKVRAAAEQARQQAEAAKVAEPAPVAQTAPQSQPAQTAPSLTVSQINARLGFVVTADFLQALGFEATQQGTRKLYYPEQFQSICQAIARHVTRIAQE